MVNLVGAEKQWSIGCYGTDLRETPRKDTLCQYTVASDEPLELRNLGKDDRFKQIPVVCGGPKLEFYYGVPLTTSSAVNVGALCVLHPSNLDLQAKAKELLKNLGNLVVKHLEGIAERRGLSEEVELLEAAHKRLAHDIRGPLSGIIGMTEVMQSEIDEDDLSNVKENSEMIHESASSLLEMADAIMSRKAKHEVGQNSLNCALLGEAIRQLFTPQAKVKHINFEVITEDPETLVYFESRYLNQVIGNLVSNAIKFTPERGRVSVRISFSETESLRPQTLKITVEDTGVGMTPDKLKID